MLNARGEQPSHLQEGAAPRCRGGLPEGRFPHGPPEDAASKVREHLLLFPRFFENPLPFLVGIYFEKPNGQRTTKRTRCQVELQHPAGVTCPSRETNLLANAC